MYKKISETGRRLGANDQGATLIEYGLALALGIFLGVAALTALSGEIGDSYGAAATAMPE